MSSPEASVPGPLGADGEERWLLGSAREAIAYGLVHGRPPAVDVSELPPTLRAPGACFVTLHRAGELRGCIGSLEPRRTLGEDVVHNAFAAAFQDPRFPPLDALELAQVALSISLLGPSAPLPARSERELLAALRPGIDGLVLHAGSRRATFLPAVWGSLPEPADFLAALRSKAGLPADSWSSDFRFERYTVREIREG